MNNATIEQLHSDLLTYWNKQDAQGMAALFAEDANMIGFDGSEMNGPQSMEAELKNIFSHHQTARYVWKVKEIRGLNAGVMLLRAMVGMVPPDKKEINPATNALQTLIAIDQDGVWKISLFQNTPAQFHGRPELVTQMTQELSDLI